MIKKFFITLWVLLFIGISSIALLFFAISQGWIGYLPDMEELENPSYKYASQIISSDGKPLGTWSYSKENRLNVEYNEISPNLIKALIATEDIRFSKHSGIDMRALLRAIVKRGILMQKNAGGGSTITQQLGRIMYFSQEKKYTRKVAEVLVARDIEKLCSKDKIFELYVNTIYFGSGYYNIHDAARGYFGKAPSKAPSPRELQSERHCQQRYRQ